MYIPVMLFNNWQALLRVFIVSILAYAAVLLLLRVSGKRTLSKMNAFDLVVTVALGSTLANVILSKQTALAEGVLALAMLIFLQYGVAWLVLRWGAFERVVKSQPQLLFYRGRFLHDAMRSERMTEGEVLAAIRNQGFASSEDVEAVVLETDASLSVLPHPGAPPATALRQVTGVPEQTAS